MSQDYKRYVGAQIGIHNPRGERVGQVGRLRNREFFYVVVPSGFEWSSAAGGRPGPLLDRSGAH